MDFAVLNTRSLATSSIFCWMCFRAGIPVSFFIIEKSDVLV